MIVDRIRSRRPAYQAFAVDVPEPVVHGVGGQPLAVGEGVGAILLVCLAPGDERRSMVVAGPQTGREPGAGVPMILPTPGVPRVLKVWPPSRLRSINDWVVLNPNIGASYVAPSGATMTDGSKPVRNGSAMVSRPKLTVPCPGVGINCLGAALASTRPRYVPPVAISPSGRPCESSRTRWEPPHGPIPVRTWVALHPCTS